ncbi:MAG: hypothetical protein CVU84_06445 [Firmicutes bacterium HGW-Firmicutes-1]|nr:MAG: hypothetical protein CVU84_06445 [Firmicutes bacterium HGW-Firmicutes-1]
MNKRKIALFLVFMMVINIIYTETNPISVVNAAIKAFIWNESDTLDTNLNIVQGKAGEDELLLELEMKEDDIGVYNLVYYLEDNQRTTVKFTKTTSQVELRYRVEDQGLNNLTQGLIDTSFREMNYEPTIPVWKDYSFPANPKLVNAGDLTYTIEATAGNQYPGVAFQIHNKKIIMKWDYQSEKVYFLITGYKAGTIVPITYKNPSMITPDALKILNTLENFQVVPTHLKANNIDTSVATGNDEISPINNPDPLGEKPGGRPGLKMTFEQPKEWDEGTWTYVTAASNLNDLNAIIKINDINKSTDDNINFNFDLRNVPGTGIIDNLTDPTGSNEDVEYTLTGTTYQIDIVQDKDALADSTRTNFIQWDALQASKIYNVSVGFQVKAGFTDYVFGDFLPISKFAYTYMDYQVKRANMTEAYLEIKPYDIGSQVELEYRVYHTDSLPINQFDLWVKHYYKNSSEIIQPNIYIPVDFKTGNFQDIYQVYINFSGTDIGSQVLNYKAKDDKNIPQTTPRIEEVDNLYVVPSDDVSVTNPTKAQFDLVWKAPSEEELETIFTGSPNDRIYYELMINTLPTATATKPFEIIKVFEVTKNGVSGKYEIKLYDKDLNDNETPSIGANFLAGYDSINGLFRMENITIVENGVWVDKFTTDIDQISDPNTYDVNAPVGIDPAGSNIPFVYYLKLKAITVRDDKIGVSEASIPASLSLSLTRYEVPIVDGVTYTPFIEAVTNKIGLTLKWQAIDVKDYYDYMLYPLNKVLEDDLHYGVYISQNKEKLLNLDIPDIEDKDDPEDPVLGDPIQMGTYPIANGIDITASTLADLRNGETIYFDLTADNDVDLQWVSKITGLDKNTNYYVRIVTKLDVTKSGTTAVKMSDPSNLLSVTTPVVTDAPNEDEIKPLSVEDFTAEFADSSQLSALLSWTHPDEVEFEYNKYGFEVISIEDKALPSLLNSSSLSLEDLMVAGELSEDQLEYWRIVEIDDVDDGLMYVLLKYVEGEWEVQDPLNAENEPIFTIENNTVSILDDTNTPNKVYYYYARTINVMGSDLDADTVLDMETDINAASPWQLDTLTTAPVQGPINLDVSYNPLYTYDDKLESIIRFDAPIPTDNFYPKTGIVKEDADYVLEVHVKGEEDADYSITKYPVTFVAKTDEGATGYKRFYYKVANLKPGKAYSIKVRIVDQTKGQDTLPDDSQAYPTSAFSERLIVRTEFDQGSYDEEIKMKKYLDYYDLKVKELAKATYFELEKTSAKYAIKYREEYAVGELANYKNSVYPLTVQNVKTNVIYLPADFIEAANANKVSLKIDHSGQSILIRPSSIGLTITKAINDQAKEILQYNTTSVDYYIKITVDSSTTKATINSKTPASPILDIKVDIVGSKILENSMDEKIIKELDTIIAWKRGLLKSALSLELANGIDETKLLKIAQDALDGVNSNFRFSSNVIMTNNIMTTTKPVTTVAKSLLLTLKPTVADATLQVIKKVGSSWVGQASTYGTNLYRVETLDLTSYVLVSQEITSTILGGKYSPQEIDVINKYKLNEIFNTSELSTGTMSLQKYRMIPALGRLLGAPVGSDNMQFLKDEGITVSSTNMYSDLTKQEVYYYYTITFAKRHSIVLNNAKITNYNMIQDISKVNEAYKNTLLIGANWRMYQLNNGYLLPESKVTVKEFIQLLTKIDQGLN